MSTVRDLADRLHRRWPDENPFAATIYGIPGDDDLVPDESDAGREAWRAQPGQFRREADVIARERLTPADAVTLGCTRQAALQDLEIIDVAETEHMVTAMQYSGPAAFLALAARTVLVDPAAAEDYLTRLRRSGAWLDQIGERLRTRAGRDGCRSRRWPSRPSSGPRESWPPPAPPRALPAPPQGRHRAQAWIPNAGRPPWRSSIPHWPDGWPLSRNCSRGPGHRSGPAGLPARRRGGLRTGGPDHTTLPLSAEALHQTGLDHVAALEARAVELGAAWGSPGWTRCSGRCGTRPRRFPRSRPCARPRPR